MTGGFVGRQDVREEKFDRGEISSEEYWTGTGIDTAVSIGTQIAGGKAGSAVTNKITQKVGSQFVGTALSGAVTSGASSVAEQSGQVLTYHATEGKLGQEEISLKQVALSAGSGMAVSGTLYGAQKIVGKIGTTVENRVGKRYGVEKIGLGRWDEPNEKSFWKAIVDKRGAHHLSSSGKTPHRQKLALGDEAFAELNLTSIKEVVENIPKLTAKYLYKKNPKKILFDLTNIDSARKTPNYTGKAEGYFAREELRILLSYDKLFNKTQFFFKGKPLWRYGIIGRKNVRKVAVKQFYGRK